jgi:hypothetical protein
VISFPDSKVVVVGDAVHVTSPHCTNSTGLRQILEIIGQVPGVGLVLPVDFAVIVWPANYLFVVGKLRTLIFQALHGISWPQRCWHGREIQVRVAVEKGTWLILTDRPHYDPDLLDAVADKFGAPRASASYTTESSGHNIRVPSSLPTTHRRMVLEMAQSVIGQHYGVATSYP